MNLKTFLVFFSSISLIHCLPIPCTSCGSPKQSYQSPYQRSSNNGNGNAYASANSYGGGDAYASSYGGGGQNAFDMQFKGQFSGQQYPQRGGQQRALEAMDNNLNNEPIVVMKNIPMNPLSDPKKLNVDDIPLVPHNQIVYIQQPYLIVVDHKKGSNKDSSSSSDVTTEGGGETAAAGGEGASTEAAASEAASEGGASTEGGSSEAPGETTAAETSSASE